jgi:threonine dehydratase
MTPISSGVLSDIGFFIHHCITLDTQHARNKSIVSFIWKKMHTLDDTYCCSGQGTVALEFLEQVPLLDAIIVPISGMFSNTTKAM